MKDVNWPGLAVFDLDRTLVTGNCSFEFCRYLVAQGVLPFHALPYSCVYFIRHTLLGMSLPALHEKVFTRFLRGKSLSALQAHVGPFIQSYVSSHLYLPALEELKRMQRLGYYTLILSNSPSFLVAPIAEYLGVHVSRSTEYAVDKAGHLCHIAFIMQGEDKALCVRSMGAQLSILPSTIIAYSDSILDLPLLRAAGTAVAVNPDRTLRRLAKKCNWSIL